MEHQEHHLHKYIQLYKLQTDSVIKTHQIVNQHPFTTQELMDGVDMDTQDNYNIHYKETIIQLKKLKDLQIYQN